MPTLLTERAYGLLFCMITLEQDLPLDADEEIAHELGTVPEEVVYLRDYAMKFGMIDRRFKPLRRDD